MSQITRLLPALLLGSLVLAGCGEVNPGATFSPETGHPAGWRARHATAGKASIESCFGCHGDNLDGGIAKVPCTSCHLGGAGAIHPAQWGRYAYARHGAFVASNGTASCANAACHGAALQGEARAPGCISSCHLGGADKKHPAEWTTISSHAAYVLSNSNASCRTAVCHGADGKGVFLSGPACDQCHAMK